MITDFSQLDLNKKYSYADYLTWQFEGMVELIRGKIYEMSPAPSKKHQFILGNLHLILGNLYKKSSCKVCISPFDVKLVNAKLSTPDHEIFSVVQPDIFIVCDESKLQKLACHGAPDLVIEVLSPGNSKKEMGVKFDLYQENEVLEYWIVEPLNETVQVYSLQDKKYIGLKPCTIDDKITSVLFPNLNFDIKEVFDI
jgi:Uma2 family endonuclease